MGLSIAMCDFCGDVPETILHVMRDCHIIMPLWLTTVNTRVQQRFFDCNLQDWIALNMTTEAGWRLDVEWKNYWAIACHLAWSWRNKEQHDDNFIRPVMPAEHVMQRTRSYRLADKAIKIGSDAQHRVVQVCWLPPTGEWVRLNTDGACKDGEVIGCGGVLRGSEGEWLGGFSKYIGKGNAYIAELWGVLEGLKLARRMNFSHIQVHVDSLVVVKNITTMSNISMCGRTLVEHIRCMLALDWEVVVQHSYREANQVADALANHGCSMTSGFYFFEDCPSIVRHLLLADVLGVSTPRLVSS